MQGGRLPAECIPWLLQGGMPSFTPLLQVASATHLQVDLLVVVALSLKCHFSIFGQGVELLERGPISAFGAVPNEVRANSIL